MSIYAHRFRVRAHGHGRGHGRDHARPRLQKDVKAELENTDDVKAAAYLGTVIGKKAVEAGIESVVFDRGGYIYHGKVKALADAAREAGLKF